MVLIEASWRCLATEATSMRPFFCSVSAALRAWISRARLSESCGRFAIRNMKQDAFAKRRRTRMLWRTRLSLSAATTAIVCRRHRFLMSHERTLQKGIEEGG